MIDFFRKLFRPVQLPKREVLPHEHQIEFSAVDPNAVTVLQGLNKNGYDAYLVGGVIRDMGSGVVTKDCDVVTSAHPSKVIKCFKRGIMIGKRFRLVHVLFGREYIEVSTFRAIAKRGKVYSASGMIKRDNVYGQIHDDVMRRDFTINALYMRYPDGKIIDYLGGWDDLQKRILRSIGPAEERFQEDPIRILRAIRFKAKLGLKMEEDIVNAVHRYSERLLDVPGQRLFIEVVKLYYSGYAQEANRLMWEMGVFHVIFPDALSSEKGLVKDMVDRLSHAADKRYASNGTLSVAYLIATIYWGRCETVMREKKVRGYSDKLARDVLLKARMDIPPRVMDAVQEIWHLQFLFRAKERVLGRVKRSSRLRAAYDLLVARATFQDRLSDLGFYWEDHV